MAKEALSKVAGLLKEPRLGFEIGIVAGLLKYLRLRQF
jgi:LytS/YehU family sensor histidine kinase